MTQPGAISLDSIFVAPSTPSFADLIDQIGRNDDLSNVRRKDLVSGLRRVAEALGRSPAQVPADPRWLQPRIARVAPAFLGITRKTWQNSISNARNAMAACGIVSKRQRRTSDLSTPWRKLWERVQASGDKSLLSPLPRFIHFLDRIGVAPQDVRNEHALLYLEAVELNEISKAPQAAYKDAVAGWNRALDRLPDWPGEPLSFPSSAKRVILQEDEHAPGFISDVDRYLDMRLRPDLLAPETALRPIAASSAATYRYMLLRFASHVAAAGVPVEEIICLQALLEPKRVELGLRRMLERNGDATCQSISDTAGLLLTVARHLDLQEEMLTVLTRFKARLAVHDPGGMTAKNRDRLRALRDPGMLHRLLNLPERIMARPHGTYRTKALRAQEDAIAIGILLYCPLRIGNLSTLDIDRHLQRPAKGRMFLVIPAGEVKNHRPLEFELPRHLVTMIDEHLVARAPYLCASNNRYLFPASRQLKPVGANALAERIKRRIRTEIGIEMNAHLFRHLAVMIYLDANPGGYEVARQMLGHSSVSRTISVYSGLETISATRAFASVVDKMREGG
ncbi:site-specific integrase [Anianabacter salinae]|uniref:site-specific integrase n=1 Tax=Anianabacter salinae TaxID=2851023 RepID=UPI00225E073F|nr:site-specific integrase [Anianabacter salinae]MBV0914219.1 site-specific integrase [Anianabacter salinae]